MLAEHYGISDACVVRQHLKEVLESRQFANCKRAQEFLTLLVEHALAGEFDRLHERAIGAEMFRRPIDYDTARDSVVRVKATEVRKKLAEYYSETDSASVIQIELPSGTYIPRFSVRPARNEIQATPDLAKPGDINLEQSLSQGPKGSDETPSQSHKEPHRWLKSLHPLRWAFIALFGIILLASLYIGIRQWHSRAVSGGEAGSIVVLPLENLSQDSTQDYFADGITEEIIADLGRVSALRTVSRTSAMSYKNTKKTLPDIARELSVQWVLEGSVLRQGSQVRVTVNLIDARTDHTFWSNVYLRDISSLLQLQGEVAESIADQIRVEVAPQAKMRFTQNRRVSKDAEDLYLQGLLCININKFSEAADLFQRAIAADPSFAQAHAALAKTYGKMGEGGKLGYEASFSKQQAEAVRAIQLDDSLAEAHAELANAAMDLNWDWTTAGKEFQRALDLNPGSVEIRSRYADYLLRNGNTSAAIAEIEQCLKLDPLSEQLYKNAEPVYYFSRRYDETLALVARSSHFPEHFIPGAAYTEKGMYDRAIAEFKQGQGPHYLGHLGNVYGRKGQTGAANEAIEKLKDGVKKTGVGNYEIALVYAGIGNKDEAFAWLTKALQQHDEGLTNMKIDPLLDPLRSDPRFVELQKQVGFQN